MISLALVDLQLEDINKNNKLIFVDMNIIDIDLAIENLKRGFPIIFQTDTLPAIACLPRFSDVLYKTKKRDRKKPLILMGSENSQLKEYVHELALEDYKDLSSKYWPGALTMVVPVAENKKSIVTSKDFKLGLRIPNSSMAKSLIKKTGPLFTSSANLSGMHGYKTAEEISKDFPEVDILGPTPWQKCSGQGSTIVAWVEIGKWKLIREGGVVVKVL